MRFEKINGNSFVLFLTLVEHSHLISHLIDKMLESRNLEIFV